MKALMRALKALADPNRMRIMKMLQHKEMCVCELKEALGIAQPSVSRHMRILENADLVEQRREGLWINYRWNSSPGSPFAKAMLAQVNGWMDDDGEIKKLIERAAKLDRNVICGRVQPRREIASMREVRR